jgi:hypothetical protein
MAPQFKHLLGGFGLAALAICALPMVADSFGAVPEASAFQINRAIKTDRVMLPILTVAKRKVPVETVREGPRAPEQTGKQKLLDGCEPAFSSVAVPSMAHIASRCVG